MLRAIKTSKTAHLMGIFQRTQGWLLFGVLLFFNACQASSTAELTSQPTQAAFTHTVQPTPSGTLTKPAPTPPASATPGLTAAATATRQPTRVPASPTSTPPTASATAATDTPLPPTVTPPPPVDESNSQTYPGLGQIGGLEAYPGLGNEQISEAYPGEAGGIFNTQGQVNPTLTAVPTQKTGTQFPTSTVTPSSQPQPQSTATRLPAADTKSGFIPREIPVGQENPSLVIWHSWSSSQVAVLEDIVRVYQAAYPLVSLSLTYIPQDELLQSYESAVYQENAPDLLFGTSDWSAFLYDQALVADLSAYFGKEFWQAITAPALESGHYRQAQVGMPYAMYGVVMYRNRKIISKAPATAEALFLSARQATKAGNVGAYLELSAYYSMAHLLGLGGEWLDEAGDPMFDQANYAQALRWMDLLKACKGAGAVDVNTSRDVSLFKQGRVGVIIDSTWNMADLAQSVGRTSLMIDPWPAYGEDKLAGFVQAHSLYLNPATAARQDARLAAALQFMAAMVSPPIQRRLSESGFIPAVQTILPEDMLLRQAQLALQSGVALPPALQGETRLTYWAAVDAAIRQAITQDQVQPKTPLDALKAAFQDITSRPDK